MKALWQRKHDLGEMQYGMVKNLLAIC
jgi:hypothetical protein